MTRNLKSKTQKTDYPDFSFNNISALQTAASGGLRLIRALRYPTLPFPVEVPLSKKHLTLSSHRQQTACEGTKCSPKRNSPLSTHQSCRWDSTDPARTPGPRTRSEDRPPRSTAPPRSAHSGTSHTETPGYQKRNN